MLHDVKEVQLLLLSHPKPDQELPDLTLIKFALIKLMNTGVNSKLIKHWNQKDVTDRQDWAQFCTHSIDKYVKLFDKGSSPNLGTNGYSGAFIEAVDNDSASQRKSNFRYDKCVTTEEGKVSNLEACLAAINLSAARLIYGPL